MSIQLSWVANKTCVIIIIIISKYNEHSDPLYKISYLFKLLKPFLKVNDIHNLQVLKFYHKLVNEQLPKYFYNYNILYLIFLKFLNMVHKIKSLIYVKK